MKRSITAGIVALGFVGVSQAVSPTIQEVRNAVEKHFRVVSEGKFEECVSHLSTSVLVVKRGELKNLSRKDAQKLCAALEGNTRLLHMKFLRVKNSGNTLEGEVQLTLFSKKTGYFDRKVESISLIKNEKGWNVVLHSGDF